MFCLLLSTQPNSPSIPWTEVFTQSPFIAGFILGIVVGLALFKGSVWTYRSIANSAKGLTDDYRQRVEELKVEGDELKSNVENYTSQLAEAVNNISILKTQIESQQAELEALRPLAAEHEYNQLKQRSLDNAAILRNRVVDLEAITTDLTADFDLIQASTGSFVEDIQTLYANPDFRVSWISKDEMIDELDKERIKDKGWYAEEEDDDEEDIE